ncbi:MAG: hypothetical protein NVSMB6_26410 [Burkholderiaceae bacterium]
MSYFFLGIAIIAEVIATSFLRQAEGFTRLGPTLFAATGYIIAYYSFSLSLGRIPTGVAYAIWSGVGIVLIAAIAWRVQGQKLDVAALAGIALIVSGVVVISVFSASAIR